MLFSGRNESRRRTSSSVSSSLSMAKWQTPLRVAWAIAPPSSSCVTSSPVTDAITSGPVMNICDVLCVMKMKSVIAGEYTAPPAHGPMTTEICGTTPEASVLRRKMSP